MRCAEMVSTLLLRGHIVDPYQAVDYRLVSGLLRVLLRNNRCSSRVQRLAARNIPEGNGPVTRVKNLLQALSILWNNALSFTYASSRITLAPHTRETILHHVRDALRRREWGKAAERRDDMVGAADMDYEKTAHLWLSGKLGSHLQRMLEMVITGAVWTNERRHRHTGGHPALSPVCTFCSSGQQETVGHLYWICPRWASVRRQYPQGKRIGLATNATPTRRCGIILRSESDLYSFKAVGEMQTMMAAILQERFAEGRIQNAGIPAARAQDDNFLPHQIDIYRFTDGKITYRCLVCNKHRVGTTSVLTSEHCAGAMPTRGRNA